MIRPTTLAILFLALAPRLFAGSEVEIHGPNVHPGYPDLFNLEYMLNRSSVSPDGRFGVIHATRPAVTVDSIGMIQDFLVTLQPFHIVGLIDADDPYFEGQNFGDLNVMWSADSSIALVKMDGKWGPRTEQLLELHDGRIVRQTDLVAEVHKLLLPDFRKVKPAPYNDNFDFILDTETGGFTLDKSGKVHISCMGTTSPKDMTESKSWSANLEAVWDVAQEKFVAQKVTRAFPKTK